MATRHVTLHYCDLCGEEAAVTDAGTVRSIELIAGQKGTRIDLCDDHADKLTEAVAPYLAAGTPLKMRQRAERVSRGLQASPRDSSAIRAWAKSEGFALGSRGRIPAHIVASYHRSVA